MAQTVAEIRAELEANPAYATTWEAINGERVDDTAQQRAAKLDFWAANERRRQLEAEAQDDEAAFRQVVHERMRELRTIADDERPANQITNTQRDAATRTIADSLWRLARILIQRGVIEPE